MTIELDAEQRKRVIDEVYRCLVEFAVAETGRPEEEILRMSKEASRERIWEFLQEHVIPQQNTKGKLDHLIGRVNLREMVKGEDRT
jgi:hypothetical protein